MLHLAATHIRAFAYYAVMMEDVVLVASIGLTTWNVEVTCSTSHPQHRAIVNLGVTLSDIVDLSHNNK